MHGCKLVQILTAQTGENEPLASVQLTNDGSVAATRQSPTSEGHTCLLHGSLPVMLMHARLTAQLPGAQAMPSA